MSAIVASEIDRLFNDGEDVTAYFDMEHPVVREGSNALNAKRITLEVPLWVADGLDREARKCGINATDLMKVWLAERLKAETIK